MQREHFNLLGTASVILGACGVVSTVTSPVGRLSSCSACQLIVSSRERVPSASGLPAPVSQTCRRRHIASCTSKREDHVRPSPPPSPGRVISPNRNSSLPNTDSHAPSPGPSRYLISAESCCVCLFVTELSPLECASCHPLCPLAVG